MNKKATYVIFGVHWFNNIYSFNQQGKPYIKVSGWRTLNTIMGKIRDKTNCTTMNIDDSLVSNPLEIGNVFCRYFTSVGKDCAAQIPPSNQHFTKYLGNHQNGSFFLSPTTSHEIISILGRMKCKKRSGHDQILLKFLKAIRGEIQCSLPAICRHKFSSLASGIVPNSLKLARVILLYKAKDKQLLSNYRPISLLPVLSKILENVVHIKLCSFPEQHSLLYDSQFGLRMYSSYC